MSATLSVILISTTPNLDLAVVALLPDPVRCVEADRLEEEHQRHPLVVRVVDPLVVVTVRTCVITTDNEWIFAGSGGMARTAERPPSASWADWAGT